MNNVRTKKFKGIDNPKFLFFIAGLLAITGLARIFGADGAGFLAGIFLGIILSYILRVRIGGNVNED
jgi:hypothetical protein